jgi:anti-sigma factor RsiW
MSYHLSITELSAFITGQAGENQQARVLRHLEKCDACLQMIDSLWSETMSALQRSPGAAMPDGRRIWLRRRVLQRIRSFETDRSIVQLALFGPIVFFNGLLEPWRNHTSKNKNSGGKA